MPPKSLRRSRKRYPRRQGRSFETIIVPFESNVTFDTSGTKQITAGDLNLDLNRPLRLRALHFSYCLVTTGTATCTMIVTLIADGQEGAVSRPHLATVFPKTLHIRQMRVMDFGLYGSSGSLAAVRHTAPITSTATTSSKPVLCITGKAIVEYQHSQTIQVVAMGMTYHITDGVQPSSSQQEDGSQKTLGLLQQNCPSVPLSAHSSLNHEQLCSDFELCSISSLDHAPQACKEDSPCLTGHIDFPAKCIESQPGIFDERDSAQT